MFTIPYMTLAEVTPTTRSDPHHAFAPISFERILIPEILMVPDFVKDLLYDAGEGGPSTHLDTTPRVYSGSVWGGPNSVDPPPWAPPFWDPGIHRRTGCEKVPAKGAHRHQNGVPQCTEVGPKRSKRRLGDMRQKRSPKRCRKGSLWTLQNIAFT